jgi:hypothetical protein
MVCRFRLLVRGGVFRTSGRGNFRLDWLLRLLMVLVFRVDGIHRAPARLRLNVLAAHDGSS